MQTDEFDYDLPATAIAQRPLSDRTAARLLVDRGPDTPPGHGHVADLPDLVGPGDVVVVNETRVRRARLRLTKPTGGAVEALLLRRHADGTWEAMVRPARRVRRGQELCLPAGTGAACRLWVEDELDGGRRLVRFEGPTTAAAEEALIDAVGEVPLPPYIESSPEDPDAYQTTYAARTGSSAAPTAGLHLTPPLLDRVRSCGAEVHTVDLEIGLDTFRPIAVGEVTEHRMHREVYDVPAATLQACLRAERVVAVGTTVVRSLEAAAATGRLQGETDLFIRRGYEFSVVDVLLTNFHFPRSTLLVLVDAFVGPRWRDLYAEARREGYRFLSFGDAMLLTRTAEPSRATGQP